MPRTGCKVCDDRVARPVVDQHLANNMSAEAIARLMTLRGFKVSAPTILKHRVHATPVAPSGVTTRKRDLATLVRDKIAERVETDAELDIMDRALQPALKTGLAAQKLLDTREARTDDRKLAITIAAALLAGGPAGYLPPPDLVGEDDPDIIEGEAVEVV